MKNLIVSLSAAVLLFLTGCQDSPVDPLINDVVDKSEVQKTNTNLHGVIQLQELLSDPRSAGNSFYRVSGQIKYIYRISYRDQMLPEPQKSVSIYFETDVDMQYVCTICSPSPEDELAGFISDVSEDFVALVGNSVSLLEKSYSIQGREDGMLLKVRFLVTYNRIELSAVWLALPNERTLATEINQY
ncbi:MAG: hypothetical protein HND39_02085 [Ignavibacteriota bacterium]|jgi:hypothetical protein|nr:MAG: hypothetical protein EDM72_09650 [Chlorobiota bacterium]MBE7477237.1 hypothetical protein [Ignavibacteriales bacterium]MBL1122623.1 hypothetical protein [Ignavibacteriota bacterium]MCC7093458.1 hypothetical protein [Ignavibacteriaceae bacterium]MCE7856297.1 hypothetical protein [Ignavibacteria bacterium CHB3]MEB2297440.1 hypothetical protein [Ignavibacteria bacterium]